MLRNLIMAVLIAMLCGLSYAQAPAPQKEPTKKSEAKKKAAPAANMPTQAEIDDAKAKGMVWVNLNSGIYHKDGEFYGKTKNGKFMTEDEAKKAGYRAAKEGAAKKGKKEATKK